MQISFNDIKNLVKDKAKAPKLNKRDEIIEEYLKNHNPENKKRICRFFVHGSCMFTAEECHFAHSTSDLIFDKPDLELYMEKLKDINSEEAKTEQGGKILDEFYQKETKIQKEKKQPSLQLEVSYKILFDFQQKMIESGELITPYTQEEIDTNIKVKDAIKEVFQRELQQELTRFFFGQYKAPFLPKGFLELCFLRIGWFSKFRTIINSHCCYEVKHPVYGMVILQLSSETESQDIIENCIVQIIKNHNLLEKRPIKSSLFLELYEKDLMVKDIFLPPFNYFLFQQKALLDDLMQIFQKRDTLIQKISKEFAIEEEKLREISLFEHEKEVNSKQREKLVEEYNAREDPNGKSQLCRFYLRGVCIFEPSTCKHAHGISDLAFKKISTEEYDNKYSDGKQEEDYKLWVRTWIDIMKEKQPSLNLEFTYKTFYEYQAKLIAEKRLREAFTQEQLDKEDSLRHQIKVHMVLDLTRDFVELLFKVYNTRFLKKAFIDKCARSIGWIIHCDKIVEEGFCYEAKIPKHGYVLVKNPPLEELTDLMEICIVKIIKNNALLTSLPISATAISKFFYKDIVPEDPTMPTLNVFLQKAKMTLDDYLLSLQTNANFISKLAKECERNEDELQALVLFGSTESEMQDLMEKVKKILHELIEKSKIGFILFNRFEETVFKRCSKEVVRFNRNLGFLRRLMRGIALASGVLVINLPSEVYLFSPKKLKEVDYEGISKKYLVKLYQKCKKKETAHPMVYHTPLLVRETSSDGTAKLESEDLEKEINLKKIKIVDDEASLTEAKTYINTFDTIAVDLEGNLNKGGMIELIQIGCGELIFIFDVYKVKNSPALHEVYDNLVACIKEIMENSKICKVLHDCRKDSLALHLFTRACPVNVFDTSAMHSLLKHLELYMAFKGEMFVNSDTKQHEETKQADQENGKTKEDFEKSFQILNCVDDIKAPGLNEILGNYGASHGINHLKEIMKKKFEEMPREYFLRRPLDKEYLIYSAKDVEDLVEVKRNIEEKLLKVLGELINVDNRGLVELLWKKVSKTYVLCGCCNC